MAKPYIMIGTPCYGGLVAQGYMESVIALMIYASKNNFDLTLAMNGQDSLITRSRNTIVSAFLDRPEMSHLMFIDADISFEPEAVHRLLSFDEDIAAGMYPVKNIDWQRFRQRAKPESTDADLREAGLNFVGTPFADARREERAGFVTGYYAGTGFMLIRRQVFTRMIEAYPETKYEISQTFPRVPKEQRSQNQYALFDCMVDRKSSIYLSEDFAFCERWRAIGGKIWLDTKTRLTHTGSYSFVGTPG